MLMTQQGTSEFVAGDALCMGGASTSSVSATLVLSGLYDPGSCVGILEGEG